jgi:phosphate starvation-inducible PhoH-like protein
VVTQKIHLAGSEEALALFGQNDQNLRALERSCKVQIFGRAHILSVRGTAGAVEKALAAVETMRENLKKGIQTPQLPEPVEESHEPIYTSMLGKSIKAKTANQQLYIEAIQNYDLVLGIGPAGTGKTFLAVACALNALQAGQIDKIVLTRPVVEAGEKLGFLPGDFYDKVDPYLRPLYDAFYAMLGPDRFRLYRDEETVEIVPLAYMRGRTLEKAFVILDEAQNATAEQVKMFLTRTGKGSRVVVNGDMTQIDLVPRRSSGLIHLPEILKNVPGMEIVHFTEVDVMRHPLVREILKAYDEWDKEHEGETNKS